MISAALRRFATWPTAAKLLLILTAALLPIGIALTWLGEAGIREANQALRGRSEDQAKAAAGAIESLIARNALALRIAAAGAIRTGAGNPCETATEALANAPAVSQRFSLRDTGGKLLCTAGGYQPRDSVATVPPGEIRTWVDSGGSDVDIRVGVTGGMATASIAREELRAAALAAGAGVQMVELTDGETDLVVVAPG